MPYIKSPDREKYDSQIDFLISQLHNKPIGEVNYVISRIVWGLFARSRNYTLGNALMGVLSCVATEFYRRKLKEYEDEKIQENGDI